MTSLGGSFRQVPGGSVPDTLLAFAQRENATQMVLGASRRSRLRTLVAGKSTPTKLASRAGHIDVHLVSREGADHGWRQLIRRAPRRRRALAAEASAQTAALTGLTLSMLRGRSDTAALLEEIREMFSLTAVSLPERRQDAGGGWCVVASAGERAPEGPSADVELVISDAFTLVPTPKPDYDDTPAHVFQYHRSTLEETDLAAVRRRHPAGRWWTSLRTRTSPVLGSARTLAGRALTHFFRIDGK